MLNLQDDGSAILDVAYVLTKLAGQFVGFTDIGSAWTGTNPFSRTNGFNTNVYGGGTNPFKATVTDFRNPFLFGYGVGTRANLLGYFIKFDYAFGIDNGEVKPPITYLTFGYDF